ncbi:PREDICTED: uncharacterized protein LOC105555996 [Vollenhovia emeryi]|uniref:uncharacterized protein LOC105555996 n=1 Tax=Vollenhovia emeryi TaxID=411798 RepID=UPI0005F56DF0|nr:PREDICTED: uncharacterized protein LOC105555996 [Vollenhovia emeryi]
MRKVVCPDKDKLRVFLPHHAVIKESSATTKTRVVFDASSQYSKGKSLNDALYKGPVIQSDLFDLIIRFRCYKYVLCADISKMYRQILVHEEQIALQSILWREEPESKIEEMELLTVTYGTKPASFLATKCLYQLAESEKVNYPKAAKIVCRDFYMDDLLTGSNTKAEIIELQKELTELLARGGFALHKWNSNIIDQENNIKTESKEVDISKDAESKLVGILWSPSKDTFRYKVSLKEGETRVTKRVMLSQICRLFDPLGLVGPVITLAKILMQELWSLGIDWDESLPMHLHRAWDQMKLQLYLLNELEIPRSVIPGKTNSQIQIHGFCDASEKAYGACVYLREQDERGLLTGSLLCSKSRVAPMKALSLPRLELCGAVLLVNLMDKVINSLHLQIHQKFYWTDSKIVLAWIGSSSRKWQAFVANRVSDIHDKSSPSDWRHISSKDNPADLISRGATPELLMRADSWWKGPPWLMQNKEFWPVEGEELSCESVPEMRKQAIIATAVNCEAIINYNKFSSLNKLLRVVAYVLRFSHNIRCEKKRREIGAITAEELQKAKASTIKLIQKEEFKDDIKALKGNNKVRRDSKLVSLYPYLDSNGILRVGGRLKYATLSDEVKHPILIPASHYFTTLVILHHHERLFHAGVQTTLNSIREEFWPIFAKSRVKKILRNCVRCRKAHPKAGWQLMGELPAVRVNISRPFYNCGVDYCGPFLVRDRIRRNSKKYKAYVAIFICMVTKAVHIELVEDLTTEAFLAALKRFIARRGKVKNMYSDNGRNFVGADRILQQALEDMTFNSTVQEFATKEQISWHFIPPRSPHYGGLWEAAVRSMKLLLKRTLGEACLTVGEMTTVLTQVEAILNSRPLTPLSEDPNDMKAITPGHFLIGENLQAYPEEDLQKVPENRLSRWQHVEQLKQQLWSRWQQEYLTTCQQRSKWKRDNDSKFVVGQLVMLKESGSLPLEWILARITEVHPGLDGKIRAVTLQTKTGIYKRAITNVAPISD